MPSPIGPNVSPPPHPLGFPARVVERVRLWHRRRRWIGEMMNVAALGRLDLLLNDVGLNRAELNTLIDAPADAGRQFSALAEAAHVDLSSISPAELRDAVFGCVRCQSRAACKRWLRTGSWAYDDTVRCPNAGLLGH